MLSKNKAKYIQSLHLRKNREKEGVFIVEGRKIVIELLLSDQGINELFASSDFCDQNSAAILKKNAEITVISNEELKKISALQHPDDALAVCRMPEGVPDFKGLKDEMTLYLDGIRDPGNMGTIVRVCNWFGIKNVFCSPDTTEIYNPKAIQASMGSFLRVNVFYSPLPHVVENLTGLGINFPVYGAFMEGKNIFDPGTFPQNNFKPGLLIIGNEANGISKEAESFVTQKISIPSYGANPPESLNAAIATSIILAEYRRKEQNRNSL